MNFREAQQAYVSYLTITKVREKSRNFKVRSFKNRIIKLRRSLPNPKTGGYFVSHDGLAINSGRRYDEPIDLETFRKIELQDWDKIYFERGQIYNWAGYTITADNITISSYGSGAKPIFLGSTDFGSAVWTSETGGYYSTPLATAPLWVTKDGEMSRQGESDWIPVTSTPSGTERGFNTATLNAFNSVEALTTAKARFKEFNFRMSYEYTIPSYNSGTGVVTFNTTVNGAEINMPMKLYGQKQFATLEGDWWYDDPNNKLWIKTASSPAGTDIRVVTESRAFYVNETTNTTISGIELAEYYDEAIETFRAVGLDLDDVYIHDIRTNGLAMFGNNTGTMDVGNLVIERCGLNAISIGAINNTTFHDITIDEIGQQSNIGWPIHPEYRKHGGVGLSVTDEQTETNDLPSDITVQRFEATNLGYQGIAPYGDNWLIEDSHIKNYCLKFTDGGGIHTFYSAALGTGSTSDGIIRRCIVEDGIGSHEGIANNTSPEFVMGVYIDNGSNNWLIEDCILFNNAFAGVYSNWDTEETTIDGCLIARNGVMTAQQGAQIFFLEKPNSTDSPIFLRNKKNVVTNNIIAPHTGQQLAIVTISTSTGADASYNPFDTGGSCDNNRYAKIYATQFGSLFGHSVSSNISAYTAISFSAWQTRNSCDAASTQMTTYIDYANADRSEYDIRVLANPTGSSDAFAVPSNFQDESNVDVSSPVTVAAYSGEIVFTKAANYYLTENFNGTNGTSIVGRTPVIGNTINVISGTHTIGTNNDLVTSSNGLVSWDIGAADYILEMIARVTNVSSTMRFDLRYADNTSSATHRLIVDFSGGLIRLRENNDSGTLVTLATAAFTLAISTDYAIKATCNGSNVTISVNGTTYINQTVNVVTGNYAAIFGDTTRRTNFICAYPLTSV